MQILDKELEAIKSLESEFNFKNKSSQEIITILSAQQSDKQKVTIEQLKQLDEETEQLNVDLDKLDMKYQELEGVLSAHTEHLRVLSQNAATIEVYMEVLKTRRINHQQVSDMQQKK